MCMTEYHHFINRQTDGLFYKKKKKQHSVVMVVKMSMLNTVTCLVSLVEALNAVFNCNFFRATC